METTTMAITEKIAKIEELKDRYYEIEGDEAEEEAIYNQVEAMKLDEIDFIHDKINIRGNFYVCPDPEGEFPHVYEIAEEHMTLAIDIIANAFLEFYRDESFFDSVGIDRDVLVKLRLFMAKMPIIRHAGVTEVELLNVRWLNHNR